MIFRPLIFLLLETLLQQIYRGHFAHVRVYLWDKYVGMELLGQRVSVEVILMESGRL